MMDAPEDMTTLATPPARPAISPDALAAHAALSFKTATGSAYVYAAARDIPAEIWTHAFAGHHKDHRYYEIAADTLSGQFKHTFLVVQNASTGQTAVQPLFVVDQDILEGVPANVHNALSWPRKFFPGWLKMPMLVAGCSAGDGALDCSEPWAVTALVEAIRTYSKKSKASMILMKDFPREYRKDMLPSEQVGDFRRVPSMPGCVLDLDFATFEEFMSNTLGRKLRYKYLKLNKKPPIDWEVVTDVTAIADELFDLYKQTHDRSKMRFEQLTPEFFARVGRDMPDIARYFIWRVDGRIAAFALCLVHGDVIQHLNIGFDYSVSLDLQLYYVTMRDILTWSVKNGIKRYDTGQLNYDPKLHFKMKLAPLDLYSRHCSPLINPVFKIALTYLQPVRHELTVQQFPNVSELE